jgi:hypothetical protein
MPGNAESLNVAIATSVIIYEKIRQDRLWINLEKVLIFLAFICIIGCIN